MDCIVHGVPKSWTGLSDFHFTLLSLVVLMIKNQPPNAGDMRYEFDPWVGKIPWRRTWQTNPVFLPGKFHGQGSLVVDGFTKSQT